MCHILQWPEKVKAIKCFLFKFRIRCSFGWNLSVRYSSEDWEERNQAWKDWEAAQSAKSYQDLFIARSGVNFSQRFRDDDRSKKLDCFLQKQIVKWSSFFRTVDIIVSLLPNSRREKNRISDSAKLFEWRRSQKKQPTNLMFLNKIPVIFSIKSFY